MVLLAAAVCTKAGKALVSRQFVEMTRSHVEGLLSSFSKLIQADTQHTFVETESVRYVYQPMESLYMLLITTKQSNILEDLETLRLFSRVINEYCPKITDESVVANAFNLIFAFDEVVALGYRENVNLNQIKTFTEMDSQDEKVYMAVRKNQEREAKEVMMKRAKELDVQRREQQRGGRGSAFLASAAQGFGSSSVSSSSSSSSSMSSASSSAIGSSSVSHAGTTSSSRPTATASRGMVLGAKKGVDSFLDSIISEGGKVSAGNAPRHPAASAKVTATRSSVHIKVEERISMTAGHDSGMESLEVRGIVQLNINSEDDARCRIAVRNDESRPIQFQTHPNVDKKLFGAESAIALKQAGKAFPLNSDVPVLKWRFATNDESHMPLSINCWPTDAGDGKCDVNIEYELLHERLELRDIVISIPCPSGVGSPTVGSCDGEYNYEARRNTMEWRIPVIDQDSKQGSMEFTIPGRQDDFFPVTVSFTSETTFCDLGVTSVVASEEGGRSIPFSNDNHLIVEKYIIN